MNKQSADFWRSKLASAAIDCGLPIRIMEVCGSHTNAIAENHLRKLLPDNVRLISGPGCPICVSGVLFIEKIRTLLEKGFTVAVFGDLLRIPGNRGVLLQGANLKVVYSPDDALAFACNNPHLEVVFAAVGFAPTLSITAALMSDVIKRGIKNFSLLCDFKDLQQVLTDLCARRGLSGLLLPGHVASITGRSCFQKLPVPGVISGFTAENILHSLYLLIRAISRSFAPEVINNYPEAVRDQGNICALELIGQIFESGPGIWRGLGEIPGSGWRLKKQYADYDVENRCDLSGVQAAENPFCRCGEVLSGAIEPFECGLFGKDCTPQSPIGACMSSSEGTCAAAYAAGGRL